MFAEAYKKGLRHIKDKTEKQNAGKYYFVVVP